MIGLRAKQKADRNQRIVAAATRLFREDGYDRTKLETIAAAAEISVGTVYNYYENKGDLLLAIVSLEVNEVLNAGSRLIAAPQTDAHRALDALMSIYLDHSLIYLSKEMWREAIAIMTRRPETEFGRAFIELDGKLMRQIRELILRLRAKGSVKVGIDARSAGELLFNNMNMMFTVFIRDDTMDLHTLKTDIQRQNKILIDALRC